MERLEIERKSAAPADLERRIETLGAVSCGERLESDAYYNAPDRDFAASDEALRIRSVGDDSCLTYKGPRLKGAVKTRKELEIRLAPGAESREALTALLLSLGYRPVAIVRKHRALWQLKRDGFDVAICLDSVESVGRFVEVEIIADAPQRTAAERVIAAIGDELGLAPPEPRSYLQLLLESQQR